MPIVPSKLPWVAFPAGSLAAVLLSFLLCGCDGVKPNDADSGTQMNPGGPGPMPLPSFDAGETPDSTPSADSGSTTPLDDGGVAGIDGGSSPQADGGAPNPIDKSFIFEVITYAVEPNGALKELQRASAMKSAARIVPVDGTNIAAAEIRVSPNGKALYVSIRDSSDETKTQKPREYNTIVQFDIGVDGKLALKNHTDSGGAVPEGFIIGPDGTWLTAFNKEVKSLNLFTVDGSGALTSKGLLQGAVTDGAAGIATMRTLLPEVGFADVLFVRSNESEITSFLVGKNALTKLETSTTTQKLGVSYFSAPKNRLYAAGTGSDSVVSFTALGGRLQEQSVARSVRTKAEQDASVDKFSLAAPVYIDVDSSGRYLVSGNYVAGIWLYPLALAGC